MSMQFRGRLSFPKFDAAKYTKSLEQAAETQVRQAAREWLRAVIPKVPVWAGTSRGSLQPLGRFLKVAVPISPVPKTLGRKGVGPSVGNDLGSFKFERSGKRFTFRATTEVTHFIYNNFYQAPNPPFRLKHPTPWHAFEAGDAAFVAYMKETVKLRIPKIAEFISYGTKIIS